MNPLSIIALVTVGALFGFAWHNQSARSQSSIDSDESAFREMGQADWGLVAIWSFVFLSFAAFLIAGSIIWIKIHGDFPR